MSNQDGQVGIKLDLVSKSLDRLTVLFEQFLDKNISNQNMLRKYEEDDNREYIDEDNFFGEDYYEDENIQKNDPRYIDSNWNHEINDVTQDLMSKQITELDQYSYGNSNEQNELLRNIIKYNEHLSKTIVELKQKLDSCIDNQKFNLKENNIRKKENYDLKKEINTLKDKINNIEKER